MFTKPAKICPCYLSWPFLLFLKLCQSLWQNHPFPLARELPLSQATTLIRKDCGFCFGFVFNKINASPLIGIWLILLSVSRQGLRRECRGGREGYATLSHCGDKWVRRGWGMWENMTAAIDRTGAGEQRCNITELVKERMACETEDKSKDYDSTWGRESWEGFNEEGVSVAGRMEGWQSREHSIPALSIGTCWWEPWIKPSFGKTGKKLKYEQAYCLFFHRTASNSTNTVDEWDIHPNSKLLQGKASGLLGFCTSQSLFQFL